MTIDPLAWRLRSQKLVGSKCRTPADAIAWLGAMQAQDYTGAKWAIGLRARAHDKTVDRAFDEGAILRTHMMRPTWHFVAPADIRWMQKLTGPRVNARNALYYRRGGLDPRALRRGVKLVERSLRDLNVLTRDQLATTLAAGGLPLRGEALAYLMMHAELECVVCSGPRRGKQFTYALLDERVPPAKVVDRDEGLAELARRYFASHGPATLRDFVWWSGLTMRDAREGVALNGSRLTDETIGGLRYWFSPGRAAQPPEARAVFLLPNYDEFGIAYRDRVLMESVPRPRRTSERDEFAHLLVIDRQVVGRWRRESTRPELTVAVQPFRSLTRAETRAVEDAVDAYGAFMGLAATMSVV